MPIDDALAFCRRRLEAATDRAGDLQHASTTLRDDDQEAERVWGDALALDVRRRDLTPHQDAADRQRTTLLAAIESGRDVVASLEELGRVEDTLLRAVATARTAIQAAEVAITEARRDIDAARASTRTAESECANANGLLAGL